MANIQELQNRVWKNKLSKGFDSSTVAEDFVLTYGELGEAYEAWRKKLPDFGSELADVVIYILGLAEKTGINLEKELMLKMDKNEKRTYKKINGVLTKEDE